MYPMIFAAVLVLLCSSVAVTDAQTSRYLPGEKVPLWLANVDSYINHSPRTFNCPRVPPCDSDANDHKWGGLPEVYNNETRIASQIPIVFKTNVNNVEICAIELNPTKLQQLVDAVHYNCWSEFVFDGQENSPNMFAYIRDQEVGKHLIFTHMDITIYYNGNSQIVDAKLSQGNPMPLEEGARFSMTYSVAWISTE